MIDPSSADLDRVEAALGWRPSSWASAVTGRANGPTAARWIVADGLRTAFVKLGSTPLTADWFRREYRTYQSVRGPSLPKVLGFSDDGQVPALALEDLSSAHWPPPWHDGQVRALIDALELVHGTPPPGHLDPVRPDALGWTAVAANPRPFLGLGLCSTQWLEGALPTLLDAAAGAPLAGDALVHLDVRSDNVCFRDGKAVLVDWVAAGIGNPNLDVAFWLPSLAAEDGPPPESILPNEPELAAWVAGFFCSRAGLPPIPDAPHVRGLQLSQARAALPWATRALSLALPRPQRSAR